MSEVKTKEADNVSKSNSKNLVVIGVNLVLALISVYVFEFWFKSLMRNGLDNMQIAANIGMVVLATMTYFVAQTYYTKGVLNNIKKILITMVLSAGVLGLMFFSVKNPSDIIYPFSGLVVVSIAFYMLSLTAGTLSMVGIAGISLIAGAGIGFAKIFGYIDWHMVKVLSELTLFVILFFGGTWAEIRAYLHGIRGVNKDNGFGDANDGDGDTGDE